MENLESDAVYEEFDDEIRSKPTDINKSAAQLGDFATFEGSRRGCVFIAKLYLDESSYDVRYYGHECSSR